MVAILDLRLSVILELHQMKLFVTLPQSVKSIVETCYTLGQWTATSCSDHNATAYLFLYFSIILTH